MKNVLQNQVALRAITLQGVKSYLYGVRLEVRPLTILCGTNGSGKSVWFKVLNILKESHRQGKLPFDFAEDSDAGLNARFINTYLHDAKPEDVAELYSRQDIEAFGPPGTESGCVEEPAHIGRGGAA